ncbi:hypothetical protein, partial [Frankia sp. CIT1]|uniref:hypothetical protein n=1 Tax=Frankia sp. CIT1 TaxID=2880974 RepID=UPI001EF44862
MQIHDRDIRNYPLNNFPAVLDPRGAFSSKRLLKLMVLDGTVPSPDLGTEVLERLGVIRDNGGYRERTIAEAA